MASILLPTRTWTAACDEIVAQIERDDELLIICDHPTDPVTDHPQTSDENVDVLVAGEPHGCSGKANAIACGLEQSSHERIIWTDADFSHGDDWLSRMKRLNSRHGAVSGIPVFVSDGWTWWLFEPALVVFGTLPFYLNSGVWGGSVIFERSQIDLKGFIQELHRALSDDGLLWEYLDEVTTTRKLIYEVPVESNTRIMWHRLIRFHRIFHFHSGSEVLPPLLAITAFIILSVTEPLVAAGLAVIVAWVAYRFFGIRRSTYLLAFPSFLCLPFLSTLGAVKKEFVWNGRRYRWEGKLDVVVLSSASPSNEN